jgi:hypothetical protein
VATRRVRTETFGTPVKIDDREFATRVVIHCGCCLFIGEGVAALLGRPCSRPHQAIIDLALARARVTGHPADALLEAEAEVRGGERGE